MMVWAWWAYWSRTALASERQPHPLLALLDLDQPSLDVTEAAEREPGGDGEDGEQPREGEDQAAGRSGRCFQSLSSPFPRDRAGHTVTSGRPPRAFVSPGTALAAAPGGLAPGPETD